MFTHNLKKIILISVSKCWYSNILFQVGNFLGAEILLLLFLYLVMIDRKMMPFYSARMQNFVVINLFGPVMYAERKIPEW